MFLALKNKTNGNLDKRRSQIIDIWEECGMEPRELEKKECKQNVNENSSGQELTEIILRVRMSKFESCLLHCYFPVIALSLPLNLFQ